jgi:hypothetical protein
MLDDEAELFMMARCKLLFESKTTLLATVSFPEYPQDNNEF